MPKKWYRLSDHTGVIIMIGIFHSPFAINMDGTPLKDKASWKTGRLCTLQNGSGNLQFQAGSGVDRAE